MTKQKKYKIPSSMGLREYFDHYHIKIQKFCEDVEISTATLYRIMDGHDMYLSLALKIEEKTEGRVRCENLRPTLPLKKGMHKRKKKENNPPDSNQNEI